MFPLHDPTDSMQSQWSPDKTSVFGSSAEDGLLNIWDYEKVSFLRVIFPLLKYICFIPRVYILNCQIRVNSKITLSLF